MTHGAELLLQKCLVEVFSGFDHGLVVLGFITNGAGWTRFIHSTLSPSLQLSRVRVCALYLMRRTGRSRVDYKRAPPFGRFLSLEDHLTASLR